MMMVAVIPGLKGLASICQEKSQKCPNKMKLQKRESVFVLFIFFLSLFLVALKRRQTASSAATLQEICIRIFASSAFPCLYLFGAKIKLALPQKRKTS